MTTGGANKYYLSVVTNKSYLCLFVTNIIAVARFIVYLSTNHGRLGYVCQPDEPGSGPSPAYLLPDSDCSVFIHVLWFSLSTNFSSHYSVSPELVIRCFRQRMLSSAALSAYADKYFTTTPATGAVHILGCAARNIYKYNPLH